MSIHVDLYIASRASNIPSRAQVTSWVQAALTASTRAAEVSIRIVDKQESQALNRRYRQQDKPTNVLSFAADIPDIVASPLLGDLVICAPIVAEEAAAQQKENAAHWAHMVIHGTLHLLGYDHIDEDDATEMETLEIHILDTLGFASPY